MIKVSCEIHTYNDTAKQSIKIHNHWTDDSLVEIEVSGERFFVKGDELKAAVNNCMNTCKS
jgi:hypothetical protein